MRANKGECARISHSEEDEKTPNFLRLTEKEGKKTETNEEEMGSDKRTCENIN